MEDIKLFINSPIKYMKKNFMKIKPIYYNNQDPSFKEKYKEKEKYISKYKKFMNNL
jgi:hypothetical protein